MPTIVLNLPIKPDVSQVNEFLKELKAALGKLGADIKLIDANKFKSDTDDVAGGVKKVGDAVDDAAKKSSAFPKVLSFAAIIQGARELANTVETLSAPYRELDASLRNIGVLGVKNFEQFKDVAVDLSKSAPDSAAAIADAIAEGVGSGVIAVDEAGRANIEQGKKFITEANQLAVAGSASIGTAVNGVASTLNSYHLAADEAGRISDVLFNTFNLGVASVADLAKYMPEVTSLAAPLGISFEQLGASYATMTKQGNGVPQTTTKIKALLTELQKPGSTLAPILDQAGVSIQGFKDGTITLQDAASRIGAIAASQNKEITQLFSSTEAAGAVIALSGENAAMAMEDLAGIGQRGTVAAGFEVQADSIENKMKIALNNVNAAFISFFDTVGGGVTATLGAVSQIAPMIATAVGVKDLIPDGALDGATEKIKGLGKSIGDSNLIKEASGKWSSFFTSLGSMKDKALAGGGKVVDLIPDSVITKSAGIFGRIASLASGLVGKFVVFGRAIASALLGPWGLAIAAVVAGLVYFFTQTETGREVFQKLMNYASAAWEFIKTIFSSLGDAIGALFGGDFSGFKDALTKGFGDAVGAFKDSLNASEIEQSGAKLGELLQKGVEQSAKNTQVDVGPLVQQYERATNRINELLDIKAKSGLTDEQQAELTVLQAKAQQTGNTIAGIAPEARAGMRTIVTATGELKQVFDINIDAAKKFAATQKQTFGNDLKKAAADYSNELKNNAQLYTDQKKRLEEIKKAAQEAAAANDSERVKKLAEEYNKLQGQVTENGKVLVKSFQDGAAAGLVTEDAIKAVAKAQGITDEQAKRSLLASELKKAADSGKITDAAIAEIAKKYGVSAEEAKKLLAEQRKQTEEAAKTEEAVKSIADAFNESKKQASELLNTQVASVSGLIKKQKELSAQLRGASGERRKQIESELRATKSSLDAEIAKGKEAASAVSSNTAAEESAKKILGLSKEKKKEGKSAFDLALAEYEAQKKSLATQTEFTELQKESERLKAGREKTSADDIEAERRKLDTIRQQREELLKIFGVETDANGKIVKTKIKVEGEDLVKLQDTLTSLDRDERTVDVKILADQSKLDQSLRDLRLKDLQLKFDVEPNVQNGAALVAEMQAQIGTLKARLDIQGLDEETRLKTQDKINALQGAISNILKKVGDRELEDERKRSEQIVKARQERLEKEVQDEQDALERRKRLADIFAQVQQQSAQKRIADLNAQSTAEVDAYKASVEQGFDEREKTLENLRKREAITEAELSASKLAIAEERAQAEAEVERRRADAVEEARKRELVLQELLRGQELERERQHEAQKLEIQRKQLQERLALIQTQAAAEKALLDRQRQQAVDAGALAQVAQLDEQLRKLGESTAASSAEIGTQMQSISEQIADKGSLSVLAMEQLSDALTEAGSALFSDGAEGVKDSFRKLFAVLAGAISRMASSAILQMLFSPAAVESYALLGPAAPAAFLALKAIFEGAVNALLTPFLSSLLSFPTGAVFNSPTVAVIGDGARLGGSNKEFLLREEQFQAAIKMALSQYESVLVQEVRALRHDLRSMVLEAVIDAQGLRVAVRGAEYKNQRRTYPK